MREFVDLEKSALDESMRVAAPMASGKLLDVGCGDKPYESLFQPFVTQYVGAEYDATYTGTPNGRKGKADVVYAEDRLPFADGAFECVLCNQVGEHVPEPAPFFAELVRVLAPGGRLFFTVPFSYRIHSEPNDFHRFTKYALVRYAESNGLTVEKLLPRGGFWKVIGQKLSSHMALSYARLGSDIQQLGGFGYEQAQQRRPRYWVLPAVAPAMVAVVGAARILDRVDRDDSDTLGYLLIAKKPG